MKNPSMIVAVGGTGHHSLAHLKTAQLLGSEHGERISFVSIDTDSRWLGPANVEVPEPPELMVPFSALLIDGEISPSSLDLPLVEIDGVVDASTIEAILEEPDKLYKMTPRNFEHFTAELFRGLGYEVEVTKATGDGGIDLVVSKTIDGMHHRYAVQCKHTRKPGKTLGVAPVRELLGAIEDRAHTAGIMVTNALLSKPARELIGRHDHCLFGNDFSDLKDLMRRYLRLAFAAKVLGST